MSKEEIEFELLLKFIN